MSVEFLFVIAALIIVGWSQRRAFAAYRARQCAGKLWRRQFPTAPKADIRLFLDCLVDGMGFPRSLRLQFQPSDEVVAIYRSLYGGQTPFADAMECESFAQLLASEFKVPFETVLSKWHERVTLAELFTIARSREVVLPNTSLERTRER
jgi:hypothetical protein